MSQPSLLAHVVAKFSPRQWENVASESLRYLLQCPGTDQVMAALLAPLAFSAEPLTWQGQVYGADDPGIPDLVGVDPQGRPALVIEAKFRALLTGNQPETYLDRQGRAFGGDAAAHLMLFLVPERRRHLLVLELEDRLGCARQEIGGHAVLSDAKGRRVVVVSWGQLLRRFKDAFEAPRNEQALQDLAQLSGLCDRADSETMMPLAAEDVSSEHGLRYWQFCDVIEAVVRELEGDRTVTRKGLANTAHKGVWGLYCRAGEQVFAVAVLAWSWADKAPTPWWVRLYDPSGRVAELLEPMRTDPGVLHLTRDSDNYVKVGLRPVAGVEQEALVAALAATVRRVCELVAAAPALTGKDADADQVEDAEPG